MQLTEKYPRRNCCITHDTNYPTAAKLSQRTIQTGKASRTNAKPWCGYCCWSSQLYKRFAEQRLGMKEDKLVNFTLMVQHCGEKKQKIQSKQDFGNTHVIKFRAGCYSAVGGHTRHYPPAATVIVLSNLVQAYCWMRYLHSITVKSKKWHTLTLSRHTAAQLSAGTLPEDKVRRGKGHQFTVVSTFRHQVAWGVVLHTHTAHQDGPVSHRLVKFKTANH